MKCIYLNVICLRKLITNKIPTICAINLYQFLKSNTATSFFLGDLNFTHTWFCLISVFNSVCFSQTFSFVKYLYLTQRNLPGAAKLGNLKILVTQTRPPRNQPITATQVDARTNHDSRSFLHTSTNTRPNAVWGRWILLFKVDFFLFWSSNIQRWQTNAGKGFLQEDLSLKNKRFSAKTWLKKKLLVWRFKVGIVLTLT